jgi:hypothetical protein
VEAAAQTAGGRWWSACTLWITLHYLHFNPRLRHAVALHSRLDGMCVCVCVYVCTCVRVCVQCVRACACSVCTRSRFEHCSVQQVCMCKPKPYT